MYDKLSDVYTISCRDPVGMIETRCQKSPPKTMSFPANGLFIYSAFKKYLLIFRASSHITRHVRSNNAHKLVPGSVPLHIELIVAQIEIPNTCSSAYIFNVAHDLKRLWCANKLFLCL